MKYHRELVNLETVGLRPSMQLVLRTNIKKALHSVRAARFAVSGSTRRTDFQVNSQSRSLRTEASTTQLQVF